MKLNPFQAITIGFAVAAAVSALQAGGTTQPIRIGSGWYTISKANVDAPKS